MTNQYEIYIQHHGVKGMRWGVRKAISKVGGFIKKKADERKDRLSNKRPELMGENKIGNRERDIINSGKTTKKLMRLSDAELMQKIDRLRLESSLRELSLGLNDKQAKKLYKKRHHYSDDELRVMTNRMRLEYTLKQEITKATMNKFGLATRVRTLLGKTTMTAATNFIYDGQFNVSQAFNQASYEVKKEKINKSMDSDAVKEIKIAMLNVSDGRNRKGKKVSQ